jgi:hypothetical protein
MKLHLNHALFCAVLLSWPLISLRSAQPSGNLDSAIVYPNPFRPPRGDTKVTFAHLPANTRIRIYTLAGEKVADLNADNATGLAAWDGNNGSGNHAASGVYLALVEGNDQEKMIKVAVER